VTLTRRWASGLAVVGALGLLAARPGVRSVSASDTACTVEGVDRIVAVGDVHGAYEPLVAILQAAGILDRRLRWAGGRAHLVQTGDILDRGPDSRKALDLLRRLEDEARRAGGAAHLLLGNHEVMRMLGDLRFVAPGEYDAFTSATSNRTRQAFVDAAPADLRPQLLKETPLGFVEMRLAFGREGEYGRWLRKLDVAVKINGIVFLHGGISPATAHMDCDTLNAAVRQELTSDLDKTRAVPLASLAAREDGPLWYRGLAEEPDAFAPQVDEILSKQKARAIVVGHTVAPDGRIRARFGGKIVQIDTGMQRRYVPAGRGSALQIQQGMLTAIYEDGQEPLESVPAQTANTAAPSR
jgi:hypothetical protein